MNEQPKIKLSASADGKRNAYYLNCKCVGHNRAYATCLHLIEERKHGRLDALYADCSGHIGQKRCPALDMQREEVEAHKAIYFVERDKSAVTCFATAAGRKVKEVVMSIKESLTAPPPKSAAAPVGTDYAAAINAAIAETKTPAAVAGPVPGESLLDAARRLLKQSSK